MSSNNQDFTLTEQNATFECPLGGDKSDDCADCVYSEGRKLPVPHCIVESEGWQVNDLICVAIKTAKLRTEIFMKETFGSTALAEFIEQQGYDYIEFVGLCTDICVISNVMLVKAALPEAEIVVDASCCAGVTPDSHRNALTAMKSCQIEVVNE